MNKVILAGFLGNDPSSNQTKKNSTVANMRLATTEKFKNSAGDYVSRTEWHNLVVFKSSLAEYCANNLKKGDFIIVEGSLHTREYERDGVKTRVAEVVVDKLQKGPSGKAKKQQEQEEMTSETESQVAEDPSDDVPF